MNSRKVILLALAVILLAGSATGCAPLRTYLNNRVLDAWDMFTVQAMYGEGFMGNVRITKLCQIGGGFYNAEVLGFFGRQAGHYWETRNEWGISFLYLTDYSKTLREGNSYMEYYFSRGAEQPQVLRNHRREDIFLGDDRHWLSCGLTVFPMGFGFNIEFRTIECVDFIGGLFFVDLMRDDPGNPNPAPVPTDTTQQPGIYAICPFNEGF